MLAWLYKAPLYFIGKQEVTFKTSCGTADIEIGGTVTWRSWEGYTFSAYAGDVVVNGVNLCEVGKTKAAEKLAARINDADFGDSIDNSV